MEKRRLELLLTLCKSVILPDILFPQCILILILRPVGSSVGWFSFANENEEEGKGGKNQIN
jgi:hypothetical protein